MEINKRIEAIEDDNLKGIEKAQKFSLEEIKLVKETRILERQKFEEFKEIIKDEQYFRINHFKKLGINYDILIHLSAKNAGKTTELYRCITDCISRGEKFIYGRVTANEMLTEVDKFNNEKNSPVIIVEYKSRYYFFTKASVEQFIEENTKDDIEPAVTYKNLLKAHIDWVGLGMTFMNSNTLGSGTYENFTTIFFDEIVSYQPREYVNDKVLYNWSCAVSTILRNKKSLTVVMMGNLRSGVDRIPILEYYGIDISDDLRIIRRAIEEGSEPCTILYVNSGSLYKATLKNQAAVAHHGRLEDRLFQGDNKVINTSTKILTKEIAEHMKNTVAIAVIWDNRNLVLNLKETGEEPNKYILCVQDLSLVTYLDCPIYSDSSVLVNKFSSLSYGYIESSLEFMHTLCISKLLYYDSIRSLNDGTACLVELYEKYQRNAS